MVISNIIKLGLPLEQVIVIGSGVLDVLSLRRANDLDIVVTENLFKILLESGNYSLGKKRDEAYLFDDDTEIFMSWGSPGDAPNFTMLKKAAICVQGIYCANPHFVILQKKLRGEKKDKADIVLLEKWLKDNHGA